jgi:Na+/proline symporter
LNLALSALDLGIVAAYLGGLLGLSYALARRQKTGEDYFLAGRRMGGTLLALSILATQASAVSLVGAPAFVALREGGGLRWLQYELGLPLAMLLVVALLLPALRSVPDRRSTATRTAGSALARAAPWPARSCSRADSPWA